MPQYQSEPPGLIGRYPTPVFSADTLRTELAELWIKNDGAVSDVYGGNKIRKLERLLPEAVQRGARRLLTAGGAGSHHVLATTLFAKRYQLETAAVLFPQKRTTHVSQTLRAAIGLGLDALPVSSQSAVPLGLARLRRRGDYFLPPGGSNPVGVGAYADAVAELVNQIRAGALPEPDVIVVALGSGGTAAGLVAGIVREGLKSKVRAVKVVDSAFVGRPLVLVLARAAARRQEAQADLARAARVLSVDSNFVGEGYGIASRDGDAATEAAREAGLKLDSTYTAKTFAAVLSLLKGGPQRDNPRKIGNFAPTIRPTRVLYWHTLSAAPLELLLKNAPSERQLPASLQKLLIQ